jgi:hypothetical protein
MEIALKELKTQAKKLLKALKADNNLKQKFAANLKKLQLDNVSEVQLKHCQSLVSQNLGFANWQHAQLVLSGNEKLENKPDMGKVFYTKACGGLINQWFADYGQAKEALAMHVEKSWLIPYQRQFIVVGRDYLSLLNLSEGLAQDWQNIDNDLYEGYNTSAWDNIAYVMIRNGSYTR